jgi:hypothetical protein
VDARSAPRLDLELIYGVPGLQGADMHLVLYSLMRLMRLVVQGAMGDLVGMMSVKAH